MKWFAWCATPMRSTSGYRTLSCTTSPPDTPSPPPRPLQERREGAGASFRIAAVEHRRARDEDIRTVLAQRDDVVGPDSAVHLDLRLRARLIEAPPQRRDLRHDRGDEALPPEPRVHRHQKHVVEVGQDLVQPAARRRGLTRPARRSSAVPDPR